MNVKHNVFALTIGGGVLLSLMPCEAQWGGQWSPQWPMAGLDWHRSGHPSVTDQQSRPSGASGTEKWTWTPNSGEGEANAITGVALDEFNEPYSHEYKAYFFASDKKLYCVQINYNTSTHQFSPQTVFVGEDALVGTPTGTPVLALSDETRAVYAVDSDRRLYCLNAADGSLIWRSIQLGSSGYSLSAPLPLPTSASMPNEEGFRIYVPSSNGTVYAFDPSGYESDVQPRWSYSTGLSIIRPMSAVFRVPQVGQNMLDTPRWNMVLATSSGYVECLYDAGTYPVRQWLFEAPEGLTCETWPIVGRDNAPEIRIYIACYDSNNQGYIFAIKGEQYYGGTAAWNDPLTVALEGGVEKSIGKIVANSCVEVPSGNTMSYFLCQYPGTGTGKATPLRVEDKGTYGEGKWGKKMSSTSVSLTSTPIFTGAATPYTSAWTLLHWGSDDGYLYAEDTSLFGSANQAFPTGWPRNMSTSLPTQDMAMDKDGAIVVMRGNGTVRAYWIAWDNRNEE